MTKAGEKLIAAVKEAVRSAKCRHKWERLSMRVKEGKIVSETHRCGKCGVKRYSWTASVPAPRT